MCCECVCLAIIGRSRVVNLSKCTSRLIIYQRHSSRLGYMITRLVGFFHLVIHVLVLGFQAFSLSLIDTCGLLFLIAEFIIVVIFGIVVILLLHI